ncbi:hypothetical protein RhiirA1_419292 [Rhizophagus irregularis]|uniref:Uncharacterized protein n=1 Tax=Rhizophagus irregularis TaxID=588596 RepID=A0A2N0RT48_9GLOM|nr:hypothetical protein RhiirA1_419292 [Rhizophagus irregularis]
MYTFDYQSKILYFQNPDALTIIPPVDIPPITICNAFSFILYINKSTLTYDLPIW